MAKNKRRSLSVRTTDFRGKRRDIVDGAKRVFLREGFSGAGVSRIAAEAGVSKRTLYQYFRSKEDLFAEIIRGMSKHIDAPIAPASIDGHRPRATLRQLAQVTAEITVLGDGPAFYRVVTAAAPLFPQLGRIFLEQAYEVNVAHLASHFRQWNATGELHVSDPKFAADLFFNMINGIRFRVLAGAPSVSRVELKRWLDFVVDVFLNGVAHASEEGPRKRAR